VLVATLCAGTPDDPDACGHVVIPAATLATLLGAAADIGSLPRMTVTTDLPAALTHIEELVIARRRLIDDEDAADVDTLRSNPDHPAVPLVLLVAESPDPPLRARLSTALHLGHPLAISAVLLGPCPDGDTLHLDTDGTAESATHQRLAVLDATTATQLLHMLREAHTGLLAGHPPADPNHPPTAADAGPLGSEPDQPASNPSTQAEAAPAPPTDADTRTVEDTLRAPAQVLGTPALYRLDHTPVDGLREAALELLVYLAVHRDGASLGEIKEAIYGDATRERAKQRLQTDVGNLRNRVRHILGIEPDDGDPVINTGGHYHLNPDLIHVDWWTVQDALTDATATTDPAHREAALRHALDAFHGPLAQGTEYEWVLQDQEHARRQGVIIHTQLAALVADTDPAHAAGLYDAACALDPYNEDLTQAAMYAHAATGNAEAIKDRLRALRTALDELDEEPDDETAKLAAALLTNIRPTLPVTHEPDGEPGHEPDGDPYGKADHEPDA
jgi:DNA-binding SARP family transcriptional activator